MRLEESLLVSDVGWILEDYNNKNFVKLRDIQEETLVSSSRKEFFKLILEVMKTREKTVRYYMKVQELFAKIGGLINAMLIIVNILIYDYIKFKYRQFYSQILIKNIDDIMKSNSKNFDTNINNVNNINYVNSIKQQVIVKNNADLSPIKTKANHNSKFENIKINLAANNNNNSNDVIIPIQKPNNVNLKDYLNLNTSNFKKQEILTNSASYNDIICDIKNTYYFKYLLSRFKEIKAIKIMESERVLKFLSLRHYLETINISVD
jgi:hypothetical protein